MRIELNRTFSIASSRDEDADDWISYFNSATGQFSWSDLLEKRVVVVLGEAGIGKTTEFQNQVSRLQRENKAAFFVPLNQIINENSLALVTSQEPIGWEAWKQSGETGYLFLDSVDESRLRSHADFDRAMMLLAHGLRGYFGRIYIFISSRITDWSVESVRDSVQRHLVAQIAKAGRPTELSPEEIVANEDAAALAVEQRHDPVEMFVVSLDRLSDTEAKKLAVAFGVHDVSLFWIAVKDGDYMFMATRPLDLRWMVDLWNQNRSFGTYSELIDANIRNRLTEANPHYDQSGAVLSPDTLRHGAENIAAACEFSGRPFVSTTNNAEDNRILPHSVLSEWQPNEVSRLLNSAVFDEVSFGQVKFHDRTVREYLAASWVTEQLKLGLPLLRVLPLFTASPFGDAVLISSRRATLCWLAALNAQVREWAVDHFPEMFIFDGDPEAWDTVSADLAFTRYVDSVKGGLRTDWANKESEFRRVARRLPAGRVSQLVSENSSNPHVVAKLCAFIKHGRLLVLMIAHMAPFQDRINGASDGSP